MTPNMAQIIIFINNRLMMLCLFAFVTLSGCAGGERFERISNLQFLPSESNNSKSIEIARSVPSDGRPTNQIDNERYADNLNWNGLKVTLTCSPEQAGHSALPVWNLVFNYEIDNNSDSDVDVDFFGLRIADRHFVPIDAKYLYADVKLDGEQVLDFNQSKCLLVKSKQTANFEITVTDYRVVAPVWVDLPVKFHGSSGIIRAQVSRDSHTRNRTRY